MRTRTRAYFVGLGHGVQGSGGFQFPRCQAPDCFARPAWVVVRLNEIGLVGTERRVCRHHAERATGLSLRGTAYTTRAEETEA